MTLFILLTIVSCRQSTTLTENEKVRIVEDVRHTLDDYYSDIGKAGLTAEFQYLDNTSDFLWVPPGYPGSISYDSVATVLKHNAPKFRSVNNFFDTLRIIPLSEEYATYTGRLNSTMTDTTGKTITFSLVETGVLIKRKDGWKLLNGQTSVLNQ
jgi:SnoaL-like domain